MKHHNSENNSQSCGESKSSESTASSPSSRTNSSHSKQTPSIFFKQLASLSGSNDEELAIPISIRATNKSSSSTNSFSISPSTSSASSSSATNCSNTPVLNTCPKEPPSTNATTFVESVNNFSLIHKNASFIAHLETIMNAKLKLKLEEEMNLDDFYSARANDIMIYLNSKETFNKFDFTVGFRSFIMKHYHDDCYKYCESIRQFNLFRQVIVNIILLLYISSHF
jgi:hypothetical protein